MKNQLLLFEHDLETEVVAVLGQLPSRQREVATQVLAELMARSLHSNSDESGVGEKREADE